MKLATIHRCLYSGTAKCHEGNGKPRTRKCPGCGGAWLVQQGLHGVFAWTDTDRYPAKNALGVFTLPKAADGDATRRGGDTHCVRWINEGDLSRLPEAVRRG